MRSITVLCVAVAILGCGDDGSTNSSAGPVSTVRIDPSSLVLQPGESFVLTASARDNGGRVVTGQSFSWSSSASAVATIEQSGVVRAHAVGTAQITVTTAAKSTALTLVVIPQIQSIAIAPASIRLEIGSSVQLSATLFDANAQPINVTVPVTWTSAHENVATVSPNGTLTAVAAGTAQIGASVSTNLISAKTVSAAAIVIPPAQVVRVDVIPAIGGMIAGQARTMTAFPRDGAGGAILGRTITWGTTTPSLLSVTTGGVVTAASPGEGVVTAATAGITGQSAVRIFAATTDASLGTGFGLDQFVSIPAGTQNGQAFGAFRIQRTEVTRAQWQSVMGSLPQGQSGCPTCPVANITFANAQQFVQQLNTANPGANFRIPTAVEWEFAARAGTTGQYPGEPELIAHFFPTSDSHVWPVALKLPNGFGLFDVIGNVAEWVTSQTSKGGSFMFTLFTVGVPDPSAQVGGPEDDIIRIGLRLVRD